VSAKTPDLGRLLAPFLASVASEARPGFLAMLERGAAARYREWADRLGEHAPGMRACAQREEEIADRVDGLFPLDAADRTTLEASLPGARKAYLALFENLSIGDQLAIQAGAERQGAAAWRALAQQQTAPALREALEGCAQLEEESATYLEALVASDLAPPTGG
jgi:hypothetical protein